MRHEIIIPNWHPARLNQWDGRHWAVRARAKAVDRRMVAAYAFASRTPRADQKRRVSVVIALRKGQRAGDPDAYWKSLLDALHHAGAIKDDNRQWVELLPVEFERIPGRWGTRITLEDLDDEREAA